MKKTLLLALLLGGAGIATSQAHPFDDRLDNRYDYRSDCSPYGNGHAALHHDMDRAHENLHRSIERAYRNGAPASLLRRYHEAAHRDLARYHEAAHRESVQDCGDNHHRRSFFFGW